MDWLQADFGFAMAAVNLIAGQTAQLTIGGATNFGLVGIAASIVGPGPTLVPAGPCGLVSARLTSPKPLITGIATDTGKLEASVPVPPGAVGLDVWIYAVNISSCTTSNLIATTFG